MRAIPFSDSEFDVVAFKSVLGALNVFEEQNQTMNEIFEETWGNGNTIKCIRMPSGTCYHAATPKKVITLLEKLLKNGKFADFNDLLMGVE